MCSAKRENARLLELFRSRDFPEKLVDRKKLHNAKANDAGGTVDPRLCALPLTPYRNLVMFYIGIVLYFSGTFSYRISFLYLDTYISYYSHFVYNPLKLIKIFENIIY